MTEKFHYTTSSGEHITLPWPENAFKAGFIRRNRHVGQEELAWLMIEKVADEETLTVIDGLNIKEFGDVMEKWQQGTGTNLGESLASQKR